MQGNRTFVDAGRPYLFGSSTVLNYVLMFSLAVLLLNGFYLLIAPYIAGFRGPCFSQEELDEADAIVYLYTRDSTSTHGKLFTTPDW